MKSEDEPSSSHDSNLDPPQKERSSDDTAISFIEGEIEKSTLKYNRQGEAMLTVSGWLLCLNRTIIALQLAIPGSELSLARRTDRAEKSLEYPDQADADDCGFIAVIAFKERSMILDRVHFIATLENGLTVAGALELPETFIQNSATEFFPEQIKKPSEEAIWGSRLDQTKSDIDLKPPNQITPQPAPLTNQSSKKELLKEISQINAVHRLKSFLSLENRIIFDTPENVIVSILLVLHNRAEYTLDCLQALCQSTFKNFELIIIDNASTDDTHFLLDKIDGAKIVNNDENLHFVKSINQNLGLCTGKYTLLLNNDAQVTPSAIESAVNSFSKDKLTGAVGGRIIRADGLLQEAGCNIISNGGCYGYGVGMNPWDPKYLSTREVDFCSGTFLLIRTDLLNAAGGFDPRFEPAYFEEVDLQVRLGKAGYKVIYDPKAVVFHAEHGSSSTIEASKLQMKQRETFISIHKEDLLQYPNTIEAVLRSGRGVLDKRKRILVIDDDIPIDSLGTGLPRTKAIIEGLNELSLDVTYYPLKKTKLPWYQIQKSVPEKTEVISNAGEENLLKFLIERQNFYDYIWISRPHNLEAWQRALGNRGLKLRSKIIYDAESLFAEREVDKLILTSGHALDKTQRDYVLKEELKLFSEASKIIMVSQRDKDRLKESIGQESHVLAIPLNPPKDVAPFSERNNVLFVGPLNNPSSANVHGIKWFLDSVLPLLSKSLPEETMVTIIGNQDETLFESYRSNSQIEFLGVMENLDPYYNKAKVVIVPTHFSAGISLKALNGANYGVPLVTTTRIANELGWIIGEEILSADSPFLFAENISKLFRDESLWNTIRDNAISRISSEYSKNKFLASLKQILE